MLYGHLIVVLAIVTIKFYELQERTAQQKTISLICLMFLCHPTVSLV